MLDEEKIRLMTQVAIYEKNEEFGSLVLARYYREDYVLLGCIRAVLAATVTYWLIVATYCFYRFEELLKEIERAEEKARREVYLSVLLNTVVYLQMLEFDLKHNPSKYPDRQLPPCRLPVLYSLLEGLKSYVSPTAVNLQPHLV